MFRFISSRKVKRTIAQHEEQENQISELVNGLAQHREELENTIRMMESYRKSKEDQDSKIRNWFWEMCRCGTVIKAEYLEHMGGHYYYFKVFFRPELKYDGHTWGYCYRGDNGTAAREQGILKRLIQTLGVPGWEYIESDGTLKKTYELESYLNAPEDIREASDYLQRHLEMALREQDYKKIIEGGQ